MGLKEVLKGAFAITKIFTTLTGNPDPDSFDKKAEAAKYITKQRTEINKENLNQPKK
ncbi:MAG: hypothetical protein PVH61_36425 [Candidatus Aminicenantes bacterium]|jgi:hypothetical protein